MSVKIWGMKADAIIKMFLVRVPAPDVSIRHPDLQGRNDNQVTKAKYIIF